MVMLRGVLPRVEVMYSLQINRRKYTLLSAVTSNFL